MSVSYTPSKPLFLLMGGLALVSIACFVWDEAVLIWMGLVTALLIAVIADFCILKPCHITRVDHTLSQQPTVQRPFTLTDQLQAAMSPLARFHVQAVESDVFPVTNVSADVTLNGRLVDARWEVTPRERGNQEWPGTLIYFKSPLRLLTKWQTLAPIPIKVYPKLNSSLQTLLDPHLLLEQMGVKTNRFRRADQVFESLRPYVLGDNYRHIDWKATARAGNLISRQFQMEHHHNILICLDSSRLMGTLTEGITKLDWAIEASLHLAYLADHLNDKIGMAVFSNGVDRWVKPQAHAVDAFLAAAYDVKARIVEPNLTDVCANVLANQKKRSLVIFMSDFIDASSMQPFLPSFGHLNRKHCSLFIGIEDPAYKHYLGPQAELDTAHDIAKRIVAQDSMDRRQMVLQQLRKMGLRAITVTPENLVQRAMSAYLEIKMSGAI